MAESTIVIIKDLAKHPFLFLLRVCRHYLQDRCFEASGNLAFATVLSIIPVTIIMVSILSNFNDISVASDKVEEFLLENLVPSAAENVINFLPELKDTTKRITTWSLLFLLATAVLLLRSIDDAINTIWKHDPAFKKSFRLHYYVLVIILSPVLLGLSLSLTSIFNYLPKIDVDFALPFTGYYLLALIPVALNTVAFTLLYKFSPQKYVAIKYARIGGFVAAILFEIAKHTFSLYIASFPNYQIIYGALSFIPIFLLWIYISWAIILFGAEISHSVWIEAEVGEKD